MYRLPYERQEEMSRGVIEISLDQYWNQVATPFFLVVLGFGLYILFSMSDSLVGASRMRVRDLLRGADEDVIPERVPPPAAAAAAAPPPPAAAAAPPPPAAPPPAPQGGGSRRRRSH